MILSQLHLYRGETYHFRADAPLKGIVEFHSNNGDKIEIRISEDAANRILSIVADGLVEASKKVACDLTAEIINQTAALTGPDDDRVLS